VKILGKRKHITPIGEPGSLLTEVPINNIGKLPGIDEVLLEIIQAEGTTLLRRSINLSIPYEMRKNFHRDGRNLLLYLFIGRVVKIQYIIIQK
jgi:hypothetical protein